MKILLITDYLSPQTHGIAVRFEYYIKYIKQFKHNIKIYGPPTSASSTNMLWYITNPWNPSNPICLPTFELIYDVIFNKYDVIHCVYPPCVSGCVILLLSFFIKLNIVTSNHVNLHYYGMTFGVSFLYYFIKYFIYAPQYYFAKKILSPSLLEDLQMSYNINTDIIHTGVDDTIFSPIIKPRNKTLLYVGRFSPEKNLKKLIDIIPSDYTLQLVGYGLYYDELVTAAASKSNIVFVGKVENKDLYSYYQNAKAHITMSESETFCLTLLESLSCGTPIIYANCTVFNSLYKDDFPELMYNNNLDEILSYIELNELELQKRCVEYAKNHSWENATVKLLKTYEESLKSV